MFESEDAFHWRFKKVLAANNNRYGKMWECPDCFPLDGKQVMSATIYTEQCADGIAFFANGRVRMNVVKYDLI